MKMLDPVKLKNLRSQSFLAGGFTLITAGIWSIFGLGVGLITAGASLFVMQWWVDGGD
ncbi:hypothetical protein [Streptomyces uncialis]|uniref:hypothetical protein n=1 Tax=Streptomyces uncialis TaxID=1048205 RepID=UPI0037BAC34F